MPELEAQGPPASIDELNRRAAAWLDANVHAVESRSTGARPADCLVTERRFLSPLPAERFDTDYVATRRVHNILPFVTINCGLPEWGSVFGDTVIAAAILDRLMHNAVVFNIRGPSWRLREHNGLEIATTEPTHNKTR